MNNRYGINLLATFIELPANPIIISTQKICEGYKWRYFDGIIEINSVSKSFSAFRLVLLIYESVN